MLLLSCHPEEKAAALTPDQSVTAKDRIKRQCMEIVKQRKQARPMGSSIGGDSKDDQKEDQRDDIGILADVASETDATEPGDVDPPSSGRKAASPALSILLATLSGMRNK